jgi:nucleoid DNA-binding protein
MSDDNKITLHTFTALVAARAKVSSVEANTYIHQLAKTMSEELETGGYIHLYHFGRLHTTHVGEQAGHDPNSGAPLTIPEHSRVHFRAYSALRLAVNAPFRQLRIRELTPEKTAWRTRTGVWILLVLIALLLIMLGIRATSRVSTQDESSLPTEKSSEKAVVAPIKQTPEVVAPTTAPAPPVETEAPPVETKAAPVEAEPSPVEPEPSPSVAAATEIVVSPGDTLWWIAATRLGDTAWWPVIYAENRAELPRHNPDLINSGSTLRIPTLAGSVRNPDDADRRLKTDGYQIVADDYQKLGNPRAAAYAKVAARLSKEDDRLESQK